MGSKSHPKEMPPVIKKVMDKLNNTYASSHEDSKLHYELNSCLVNRYDDHDATLPEHADNEGDINAISSIFTVSLGTQRCIQFRELQSDNLTDVLCKGRSMYYMTRHSQDFYKHSLKKHEGSPLGTRYSLTFRSIHWSNFNSTALIGDSNFGPINFGNGKGKLGQSTPGLRMWAPTIDTVRPLSCTSFKNIVLMVGTNDLKTPGVTDEQIKELYKDYKTKISLIRKYNSKCRIFVCPVLPTKSHNINRRINIFNSYIYNDLCQCNLNVIKVEGFMKFLDKRSNLLNNDLAKPEVSDELHLNRKGTSVLVMLLKECIFTNRNRSRLVGSKLYGNALRGGPPHPV